MHALQQWLISQRQQQGLSQLQLAQRLGQSIGYIEKIEQGDYVLEIIEYLHYCQALDADLSVGITLIDLAISKN
jgi:transcriptional regulator with XRE-family HTH domain